MSFYREHRPAAARCSAPGLPQTRVACACLTPAQRRRSATPQGLGWGSGSGVPCPAGSQRGAGPPSGCAHGREKTAFKSSKPGAPGKERSSGPFPPPSAGPSSQQPQGTAPLGSEHPPGCASTLRHPGCVTSKSGAEPPADLLLLSQRCSSGAVAQDGVAGAPGEPGMLPSRGARALGIMDLHTGAWAPLRGQGPRPAAAEQESSPTPSAGRTGTGFNLCKAHRLSPA